MKYGELEIDICEEVYEPAEDSFMLAKQAAKQNGRILEMGTGCGLSALAAAKEDANNRVIGVDINPAAVKCAKNNANKNNIRNVEFLISNLFQNVQGTFDCILFNPPYVPTESSERKDALSKAWDGGKDGRAVLERFLDEFEPHLNSKGCLLLIQSSLNDKEKTIAKLCEVGMKTEITEEKSFFFERLYVVKATKKY